MIENGKVLSGWSGSFKDMVDITREYISGYYP